MIYSAISRVLERYFLYFSAVLLIPLSVSLFYECPGPLTATFAFLKTIALCLFASLCFKYFGKNSSDPLYRKESILLVALIWFLTAAICSLPFLFSKALDSPLDAYFESMSGLTTTGATILHPKAYDPSTGAEILITVQNPLDPAISYTFYGTIAPQNEKIGIEALGKPLLFWRSFLQWLGGMGIVVLFIAVLPALAMGGKFLFETEVPGLSKEGMTPRIKETASLLWKLYLGFTLLQTALLMLTAHLSLFDAITLSFSSISTGGFMTHNNGFEAYPSFHIQWIVALFIFLGSLNFTLYFHLIRGQIYRFYEPEFLLYLLTLIGGCLLMSWGVFQTSSTSLSTALTTGSFHALSAQTSTGFTLSNYDFWPFSCQLLMIILMFIGGMSGSTTGGLKIIRYTIILRLIKNKIETLFRPEVVRTLKIGQKEIPEKTSTTVLIFFSIVIALVVLGTYLLVLDHYDPVTALGTISCMINNTGLSFGGIGSYGSFAFLTPFAKGLSILWMVLGRLEYFTLLVLLVPAFWRSR